MTTRTRLTTRRLTAASLVIVGGSALALALGAPAEAGACEAPTISFVGGATNGDGTPDLRWTSAGNWDQERVPTSNDSVCIAP